MKRRFTVFVILGLVSSMSGCNDPATTSTVSARDLPDFEMGFTLQQGLNGYTGTMDTSTYRVPVGYNPHPGTYGMLYAEYQTNSTTGKNTYLRFDLETIKTQVTDAMNKLGSGFSITNCANQLTVNEATASVFGISVSGSSPAFSMVALKPTAPLFTDTDATTWTEANATESWNYTSGGGIETFTDADAGYNTWASMVTSSFGTWLDFRLNRTSVESWLCDPTTNKGLLLTLTGGGTGSFSFISSESGGERIRPILSLKIQIHPSAH